MKKLSLANLFFIAVAPVALLACGSSSTPASGSASASSAQSAAPAQIAWVTVRDTRESAFSIDVPKGWKTYGGMFRFSVTDARPFVDATSPDGEINIRVGDATIPPYMVANPYMKAMRPGGPRVAPYTSGDVFATKYGQARFSSMCQSLQLSKSDAMTPKYNKPDVGPAHTTAGEAIFTCTVNGQPMAGYVYAETMFVASPVAGGNWYVAALGSFLAPAAEGQAVGALLEHSGESLALNPQWVKFQQQIIDQDTQSTIAASQSELARENGIMKVQQQQNDNFNDIINGVTFTRDPTTGQDHEVQTGTGGTKWINGGNVVVQSALSPGAGFNQLQTISR